MSRKVQLIQFEASDPQNPHNNNREVYSKLKTRRQKAEWRKTKLWRYVDYTEKLDDGRGRRIIYRDSLFVTVEGLDNMTDLTEQILPQDYFKEQPVLQKHVMSKPNRLEQWFNKANAKPLNSSKAESMMQKMGWSGGALGKTGSGITEPITPNMSYAMYHKGLGTVKAEVPAIAMSKRQMRRLPTAEKLQQRQQRLNEKESFKLNVLRTILEFVRNEDEVEILFDCLLANHQRKQIHQLIEAIRSLEGLSGARLKPESLAFLDLVYRITRFNRYLLMTQSEGVMPYRYLCLFKKAPPFMYLVTTLDLRDQPKIVQQAQQPKIRNVKGKTIIKYSKHRNMYLRNIEKEEKTPEIDETVLWLFEDCPKRDNKDGNETKDSKDSNKDVNEIKDSKDSNKNEIKDEKESVCKETDNVVAETSKCTDTVKNETCNTSVINANESNKDCIKKDELLNKNNISVNNNEKASTSSETVTKKPKYEDDRFDEDNFDYSNKCDDYNNYDDYDYIVDEENMDNDEELSEIVYEGETQNQFIDHKTLLRNKIVSYFAEFVQLPQFREFKFLGKFNDEEFQVVDDFTKQVWLYLNGDPIDNVDLVSVMRGAECGFSMQEDCNGATAIMKILHNTGSIEEDESMF